MTKRWSFAAWTNSASFHWVRQEMGAAWPDCAPRASAAHAPINELRRDGRIFEVTLLLRYPCLFARPRLLDSVDHQLKFHDDRRRTGLHPFHRMIRIAPVISIVITSSRLRHSVVK